MAAETREEPEPKAMTKEARLSELEERKEELEKVRRRLGDLKSAENLLTDKIQEVKTGLAQAKADAELRATAKQAAKHEAAQRRETTPEPVRRRDDAGKERREDDRRRRRRAESEGGERRKDDRRKADHSRPQRERPAAREEEREPPRLEAAARQPAREEASPRERPVASRPPPRGRSASRGGPPRGRSASRAPASRDPQNLQLALVMSPAPALSDNLLDEFFSERPVATGSKSAVGPGFLEDVPPEKGARDAPRRSRPPETSHRSAPADTPRRSQQPALADAPRRSQPALADAPRRSSGSPAIKRRPVESSRRGRDSLDPLGRGGGPPSRRLPERRDDDDDRRGPPRRVELRSGASRSPRRPPPRLSNAIGSGRDSTREAREVRERIDDFCERHQLADKARTMMHQMELEDAQTVLRDKNHVVEAKNPTGFIITRIRNLQKQREGGAAPKKNHDTPFGGDEPSPRGPPQAALRRNPRADSRDRGPAPRDQGPASRDQGPAPRDQGPAPRDRAKGGRYREELHGPAPRRPPARRGDSPDWQSPRGKGSGRSRSRQNWRGPRGEGGKGASGRRPGRH